MAPIDDPYEFVASLARASGNITGFALQQTEIDAKQIEILKEMVLFPIQFIRADLGATSDLCLSLWLQPFYDTAGISRMIVQVHWFAALHGADTRKANSALAKSMPSHQFALNQW